MMSNMPRDYVSFNRGSEQKGWCHVQHLRISPRAPLVYEALFFPQNRRRCCHCEEHALSEADAQANLAISCVVSQNTRCNLLERQKMPQFAFRLTAVKQNTCCQ